MTTRTRSESHSIFVGDDAHITASLDKDSDYPTDVYIRNASHDTLVSLYLSPLALRELRDTCTRALKGIEFEALSVVGGQCYHCEKPITGAPVTDEGDQAWLPKAQWRTWCTEDCHVASAEKAEAS
jgi:hypothetical protein